jgi:predicted nuclease of predicted toxin-antitoxin system
VTRVYFTDRDLGKQFPRILAEAGIAVERHADLFLPDGSDEQWLEHCGTQDRIAITHNSRIRYVPNELAAVKRFSVTLLIVNGKCTTAELARNFVQTLQRIESMLDEHKPPLILKVYRPTATELAHAASNAGRVEVWYPKG